MLEAPVQASILSLGLLKRMTRQNESRLLPKSFCKVFEVTGTKIDNARQRDSKSLDVPDETAPNNAVIYKSIAAKSHFACHPAMDAGYQ
jgi:hypothetical protein